MRFIYFMPMPLVGLVAAIAIPGNSPSGSAASPQQLGHDFETAAASVNGTTFDEALDLQELSKRWMDPSISMVEWMPKLTQMKQIGAIFLAWTLREATDAPGRAVPAMPDNRDIKIAETTRRGWQRQSLPLVPALQALQSLSGLESVEGLVVGPRKSFGRGATTMEQPLDVSHSQDWQAIRTWITEPESGAYTGVYSLEQRVVAWTGSDVCWPQFAPQPAAGFTGVVRGGLSSPVWPEIRDWYQIAAVEYRQLGVRETPMHGSFPKWFLVDLPEVPETSVVAVSYCLSFFGISDFPAWPNFVTFPIGSACYNILLGSEVGQSIGRFLITKRKAMGDLAISSITVWNGGQAKIEDEESEDKNSAKDDDFGKRPVFLFHVWKNNDQLLKRRNANMKFEAGGGSAYVDRRVQQPLAAKDGPKWPYPLRPTVFKAGSAAASVIAGQAASSGRNPKYVLRPAQPAGGAAQTYQGKGKGKAQEGVLYVDPGALRPPSSDDGESN